LIAVDTSVVVAAFATWHEFHDLAAAAMVRLPRLPAQSAIESYSVLTRLPPPHRAAASDVRDFLHANFANDYLALAPAAWKSFIDEITRLGIAGGATYDALIAATTREAGATLITCDRRAHRTYQQLGIAVEFVGPSG
jgi:predicted nucleic acid-binding protein